eukprot:snap_masked-scaffold_15-processed-gene-3.21-mRNA-1 protein AED:1.00 eAED:1.00 QI:0/-1/0/0/-1/1/1/0/216
MSKMINFVSEDTGLFSEKGEISAHGLCSGFGSYNFSTSLETQLFEKNNNQQHQIFCEMSSEEYDSDENLSLYIGRESFRERTVASGSLFSDGVPREQLREVEELSLNAELFQYLEEIMLQKPKTKEKPRKAVRFFVDDLSEGSPSRKRSRDENVQLELEQRSFKTEKPLACSRTSPADACLHPLKDIKTRKRKRCNDMDEGCVKKRFNFGNLRVSL